jgi:hypothetical protein
VTAKKQAVQRPLRDPDHLSKRGVPYWWAPEWTRGTSSSKHCSYGKIKAIKEKVCKGWHGHKNCTKCDWTVNLYMQSKEGKLTYIQGSIQQEFKDWHDDRQIDYILLGETPESASDLIISETEDTQYV